MNTEQAEDDLSEAQRSGASSMMKDAPKVKVPDQYKGQSLSYVMGYLDAARGATARPDSERFGQLAAEAYRAGYAAKSG